jgi:hypothetical protein
MTKNLALIGTGQISEGHLKGVRALNAGHPAAPARVADIISGHASRYEQTVWSARDQAARLELNKLT